MRGRAGEVDKRHTVVNVYRAARRSQVDIRTECQFCVHVGDRKGCRRKHVTGKVHVVRLVDEDGGVGGGHRLVEGERVVRTRAVHRDLTRSQVARTQGPAPAVFVQVQVEDRGRKVVQGDGGKGDVVVRIHFELRHCGAVSDGRQAHVRAGGDRVLARARQVDERHVVARCHRAARRGQ